MSALYEMIEFFGWLSARRAELKISHAVLDKGNAEAIAELAALQAEVEKSHQREVNQIQAVKIIAEQRNKLESENERLKAENEKLKLAWRKYLAGVK